MEITEAEEQKERRLKKNEQSLRDLWGTIKETNVHIAGILEGDKKEKGQKEKGLFKYLAKNLPNLMKDMNINIQEAQWTPSRMNPKRLTLRLIIIELQKTKREFWKHKRKAICHKQGIINKIVSKFLIRNFGGQKKVANIFKMLKENTLNQKSYIQRNCSSKWGRN